MPYIDFITVSWQLFHPLMGPFSIVNSDDQLALTVEDRTCANGMSLNSAIDDHMSLRQKFYLGQHGSIFSAQCPGLVIAVDDSTDTSAVQLEIYNINEKKLKWKFSDGMIESVLNPGMVLANNLDSSMTLLDNSTATSDTSLNWKRLNTRLLADTDQSEWKQEWTVSFVFTGYESTSLQEFVQDDTNPSTCYNVSSAFSAAFDAFANNIAIEDAADEDQCRKVREELGFDKDHPFDTEVRDNFLQHQCDPFFSGIDYVSGEDMEALTVSVFIVS